MGSAFHQLCPRYSGTLIPTAPTAMRNLYILYSASATLQIYASNSSAELLCFPSMNISHLFLGRQFHDGSVAEQNAMSGVL